MSSTDEPIPAQHWETIKGFLQEGRTGRIELKVRRQAVADCVGYATLKGNTPPVKKYADELIPVTIWNAVKSFVRVQGEGVISLNVYQGKVGSAEMKYRVMEPQQRNS